MQPLIPPHELLKLREQIPFAQEDLRLLNECPRVDNILREEMKQLQELVIRIPALERFLCAIKEQELVGTRHGTV